MSLSIELSFQILNYLCHFIQPCICIFLNITQLFIVILFKFNKSLLRVFIKFLSFFNQVYEWSFEFCVLVFIYLVFFKEHFYIELMDL